jgi:Methyltransferase FkbM domain
MMIGHDLESGSVRRFLAFLRPISIKGKIRLGRKRDGGYVVYEKLLRSTDVLLTFGVGWDTDYEEEFNAVTGSPVHMFDHTLLKNGCYIDSERIIWLLKKLRMSELVAYLKFASFWKVKVIELKERGIFFYNEGLADKATTSCNTLTHYISRLQLGEKSVLLKIDIEGNEYPIFGNAEFVRALQNVSQIVVEWHDLKTRLRDLENILAMLTQDFDIVHLHGNNFGQSFFIYDPIDGKEHDVLVPDVLEMLLVRRELIDPEDFISQEQLSLESGLDYPNNPLQPDLKFHF